MTDIDKIQRRGETDCSPSRAQIWNDGFWTGLTVGVISALALYWIGYFIARTFL